MLLVMPSAGRWCGFWGFRRFSGVVVTHIYLNQQNGLEEIKGFGRFLLGDTILLFSWGELGGAIPDDVSTQKVRLVFGQGQRLWMLGSAVFLIFERPLPIF